MVDEETEGPVQSKDAIIESLQATCSKHGNALFEFKKRIKELTVTCAKQLKELEWYRTLKIERHEGDNDDGGVKAQMLHEIWEENVNLRKVAEAVLDAEDTLINTKDQKYTPQLKALCRACDGLAKVIGEEGE